MGFSWVVLAAVECARGGAQLRALTCSDAEANLPLPPTHWGGSLHEQYRRLGGELSHLHELEVSGGGEPLLHAVSGLASSAPSLARLKLVTQEIQPPMQLPPICSASLESITVACAARGHAMTRQPVVLTLLPGCALLREVRVQFHDAPGEGTAVKVRCHRCSQRCIKPVEVHADDSDDEYACAGVREVCVKFLQMPPAALGMQGYTVLFACHAVGPAQAPEWGHVVMPGVL